MNRREVFLAAGAGLAGLALGITESRALHPHRHDKLHGDCLRACEACSTVCDETYE